MTRINIMPDNSFDVCPSKVVYVKSNGKLVGTCLTCIKKRVFYSALPNDDNGEWYTMEQMKQKYDNLEFFIEC